MDFDWKSTLGAIAPTIATALGGPLAGVATKFIAGKLLGDENASIEDILAAPNPEQLVALKTIDAEFKKFCLDNKLKIETAEIADKQNARTENKHSIMPAVLSVGLTIVIGLIVCALFYVEPPEGSREVLYMLLGAAVREWAGAMQFWFGTTRSSQQKDLNFASNTKGMGKPE